MAFDYKCTLSLDFKKFNINTLFSVCQCDELLILDVTEDLRTGCKMFSVSFFSLFPCTHTYTCIWMYIYMCIVFLYFSSYLGDSFVWMERS